MNRSRTLVAFSPKEFTHAHTLLATRVATMMGRKFEEQDWADVYRAAKKLPPGGWSNLNIDVMHNGVGVERKMLCVRSSKSIKEHCGTSLMHPAATRSIRIPATEGDATDIAREVLRQYAELIQQRREKVAENAPGNSPDMRVGWLLWQESLKEFLYFEEAMLAPHPEHYWAEWKESGGGTRKTSKNLWVYEQKTDRKRFSITTSAGAKIQPYFDVPSPKDAHLYYFCVQGEEMRGGGVRVWLTSTTALLLKQLLGSLDKEALSAAIMHTVENFSQADAVAGQLSENFSAAEAVLMTREAYTTLTEAFAGVSDEHRVQLFIRYFASH